MTDSHGPGFLAPHTLSDADLAAHARILEDQRRAARELMQASDVLERALSTSMGLAREMALIFIDAVRAYIVGMAPAGTVVLALDASTVAVTRSDALGQMREAVASLERWSTRPTLNPALGSPTATLERAAPRVESSGPVMMGASSVMRPAPPPRAFVPPPPAPLPANWPRYSNACPHPRERMMAYGTGSKCQQCDTEFPGFKVSP